MSGGGGVGNYLGGGGEGALSALTGSAQAPQCTVTAPEVLLVRTKSGVKMENIMENKMTRVEEWEAGGRERTGRLLFFRPHTFFMLEVANLEPREWNSANPLTQGRTAVGHGSATMTHLYERGARCHKA